MALGTLKFVSVGASASDHDPLGVVAGDDETTNHQPLPRNRPEDGWRYRPVEEQGSGEGDGLGFGLGEGLGLGDVPGRARDSRSVTGSGWAMCLGLVEGLGLGEGFAPPITLIVALAVLRASSISERAGHAEGE